MAEKDYANINVPLVLTIGIVTTIVVFGLVVPGVRALLSVSAKAYDQQARVWVGSPALEQYEAAEQNDLSHYRVDEATGTNCIPIARAHELIIERAAQAN